MLRYDCAEWRDPLHVHVKYLKLVSAHATHVQRLASKMKTHTVWVVITVSYFIFTSAAVHTRSNQPFLSVKPQTSNVARSLTPHAQVAAGHAHGDAHEADQAGCARTTCTDATVFGADCRGSPSATTAPGPAGERRSVRHAARPPAGAGSISRAARRPGLRGIRAIRTESAVSRLMYHDLTPCHVAHVGRRVANTGRAPVGRGDTAGGVTVYSPPL